MSTEGLAYCKIALDSLTEEQIIEKCLRDIAQDVHAPDDDDLVANIRFERMAIYRYWVALYHGKAIAHYSTKRVTGTSEHTTFYGDIEIFTQHTQGWLRDKGSPAELDLLSKKVYIDNLISLDGCPTEGFISDEDYMKMSSREPYVKHVSEAMERYAKDWTHSNSKIKGHKLNEFIEVPAPVFTPPVPCVMYVPCIKWTYKDSAGMSCIDPRDGQVIHTEFPAREKEKDYTSGGFFGTIGALLLMGIAVFPILWICTDLTFWWMLAGAIGTPALGAIMMNITTENEREKLQNQLFTRLRQRYDENTK